MNIHFYTNFVLIEMQYFHGLICVVNIIYCFLVANVTSVLYCECIFWPCAHLRRWSPVMQSVFKSR